MLQFGMRAHDFSGAKPAATFIKDISQAGIRHVQLAFEKSFSDIDVSTGRYSAGLGNYIAQLMNQHELHCAVLGCYINPVVPDETLRQKEVAKFVERLRYAKHMGADMVGTETGRYSIDFVPTAATDSDECYKTLLKSFSEICTYAQSLGVVVGVEGVFDHTLSTPKKMKQFLDDLASPNIEVILDFANLISPSNTDADTQQKIAEQAFELYGDRISVLHIKDCVFDEAGVQKCVQPGTGLIHQQIVLNMVKQSKPYIIGLIEESTAERFASDCDFYTRLMNQ